MLADAVVDRLAQKIPALAGGRVRGALEFAELVRQKALPNYTPAAFVVDGGMSGRGAESSAGAFLQDAEEGIAVVLVLRSAGDVTGARAQPKLSELKWQVLFALCGWAPEGAEDEDEDGTDPVGVLELRRGRINSVDAGTVFYQLDFAIRQQIRLLE